MNPPDKVSAIVRRAATGGTSASRAGRSRTTRRFGCAALVAACIVAPPARAEFAFRDGDTVVFLGDSITAARGYTKTVEHYTLMRFPERSVRFWNAGWGGDTTDGAMKRLERDVFSHGATAVTVAFGVNDIGWGMRADEEHKRLYLAGLRGIIAECRKHNVRPIVCAAAITAEAPDTAERGFLQKMCDEGLALAASLGAETVDLQRGMREIQRRVLAANEREAAGKNQVSLHVADGVHLSELGHLAMAYALLKGLGAPADVSSVELDAKTLALVSADGCTVTDVKALDSGLAFTRRDRGLPLNLGPLSGLNHRFVPLPDGLNRYMLRVRNLPPGSYDIRTGDRSIGKLTARQLEQGANISSMTTNGWEPGGPWDAQSTLVRELVDARDKLWMYESLRARFLGGHPEAAGLAANATDLEDRLRALQRQTARPQPYRFELRRAP